MARIAAFGIWGACVLLFVVPLYWVPYYHSMLSSLGLQALGILGAWTAIAVGVAGALMAPRQALPIWASLRRAAMRGVLGTILAAGLTLGLGVCGGIFGVQLLLGIGYWWFLMMIFTGPLTVVGSAAGAVAVEMILRFFSGGPRAYPGSTVEQRADEAHGGW